MEHWDRLWPGGYTFAYADGLFRPSTDTFLLGAFPRLRRGMTVCDLGAGTGLLGLLLLAREPELLREAFARMPSLLVGEGDVLVVDETGKNYSGTGVDPNITGTFSTPPTPTAACRSGAPASWISAPPATATPWAWAWPT